MKVALPVWGKKLSPVFDFAHRLLVVEIENGAVAHRCYHPMNPNLPPASLSTMLADLEISVLICGSISLDLANLIRPSGIRIIPSVTGKVEDILRAYLNNTLSDARFRVPGVHSDKDRIRQERISGKG